MDIEFHYYMTYLIATKAGFGVEDALTISTACQYVDDNNIVLEIDKGKVSAYRNYISQTMNILKPKNKLFRIYPLFHFIPGEPESPTALRKDGKMHWLNTTPGSKNANQIFAAALATDDLYRIGVACHGYADTWAHQNFVGYFDDYNAMASPLSKATPNIGHADASHTPDWPALVWQDKRLLHERVDNKMVFLDAAEHLLKAFVRYIDSTVGEGGLNEKAAELRRDLAWAIGERDQCNCFKQERIDRYRELSNHTGDGGRELVHYDEECWLDAAISEKVRGLRDRADFSLARWDPITDVYTWRDRQSYRQSAWYNFQEAVKNHQNEAWEILVQSNMANLELPQL
jgi:hypothetical protein